MGLDVRGGSRSDYQGPVLRLGGRRLHEAVSPSRAQPRRLPSPGPAAHGERTDASAGTCGEASGERCGRWKRPFESPRTSSIKCLILTCTLGLLSGFGTWDSHQCTPSSKSMTLESNMSRIRSDTVGEPTSMLQDWGCLSRLPQASWPSKKADVRHKFQHF